MFYTYEDNRRAPHGIRNVGPTEVETVKFEMLKTPERQTTKFLLPRKYLTVERAR